VLSPRFWKYFQEIGKIKEAFDMKAIYKLVTISKDGVTKTFCNLKDYSCFIDEAFVAEGYSLNGNVVFSKNTDSLLYILYKKANEKVKISLLKNTKLLINLEKHIEKGHEFNLDTTSVEDWNQYKKFEELQKKWAEIVLSENSQKLKTIH
jgi:hypothetical protein